MTMNRRPMMIILCSALAGLLQSGIVSAGQPEGIEWRLVEVGGEAVAPLAGKKHPSLKLDADQRKATGYSGCNNLFSTYRLDGLLLKFGPIGMTRRTCPNPATVVENAFLKALERTRGWKIRNGALLLVSDDEVLARFTMSPGEGTSSSRTETSSSPR